MLFAQIYTCPLKEINSEPHIKKPCGSVMRRKDLWKKLKLHVEGLSSSIWKKAAENFHKKKRRETRVVVAKKRRERKASLSRRFLLLLPHCQSPWETRGVLKSTLAVKSLSPASSRSLCRWMPNVIGDQLEPCCRRAEVPALLFIEWRVSPLLVVAAKLRFTLLGTRQCLKITALPQQIYSNGSFSFLQIKTGELIMLCCWAEKRSILVILYVLPEPCQDAAELRQGRKP